MDAPPATVRVLGGMSPFLLGAGAMFATMYSTQAILPQLGDSFGVSPSEAGLTISVLVVALAVGAWIWGPLSDRIGLRRSLTLASTLLVVPALVLPLAPTFALLLVARAAEGLVMPGLLTVGVGYIADVYKPRIGSRAMGYYVSTLVVGGLVGRFGRRLPHRPVRVADRHGRAGRAALPSPPWSCADRSRPTRCAISSPPFAVRDWRCFETAR